MADLVQARVGLQPVPLVYFVCLVISTSEIGLNCCQAQPSGEGAGQQRPRRARSAFVAISHRTLERRYTGKPLGFAGA